MQMDVVGSIKVGRSSNVEERRLQLQTGCPHALKIILLVDGQGWREKAVHALLQRGGLQGEWFTEEVLSELPADLYGLLDLETQDWWRKS